MIVQRLVVLEFPFCHALVDWLIIMWTCYYSFREENQFSNIRRNEEYIPRCAMNQRQDKSFFFEYGSKTQACVRTSGNRQSFKPSQSTVSKRLLSRFFSSFLFSSFFPLFSFCLIHFEYERVVFKMQRPTSIYWLSSPSDWKHEWIFFNVKIDHRNLSTHDKQNDQIRFNLRFNWSSIVEYLLWDQISFNDERCSTGKRCLIWSELWKYSRFSIKNVNQNWHLSQKNRTIPFDDFPRHNDWLSRLVKKRNRFELLQLILHTFEKNFKEMPVDWEMRWQI